MNLENLSSKAKARAMETIANLMKEHKDQYKEHLVSDMKEFAAENDLQFDEDGNLL